MIQKQIITKIRYILSPDEEEGMKFPKGWQKVGPGIYENTTEITIDLSPAMVRREIQ